MAGVNGLVLQHFISPSKLFTRSMLINNNLEGNKWITKGRECWHEIEMQYSIIKQHIDSLY